MDKPKHVRRAHHLTADIDGLEVVGHAANLDRARCTSSRISLGP
jgi:hypothetical protein